MRCTICGEELENPTYRKLRNYQYFPMHAPEDWNECFLELSFKAFEPLKSWWRKYLQFSLNVPSEFLDIQDFLRDLELPVSESEESTLIDLFQYQEESKNKKAGSRLWDLINRTFPRVRTHNGGRFIPITTSLERDTYQKLVAYELSFTSQMAGQLRNTTQEVFNNFQTGKMPTTASEYTTDLPSTKAKQNIRIPERLQLVFDKVWIKMDRPVERVLMTFAETLTVTPESMEAAYLVMNNGSPSAIKRKITKQPASKLMTYINEGMFPPDKRTHIHEQLLQHVDVPGRLEDAAQLNGEKRSSVRVDYADYLRIVQLAKDLRVPAYKIVTALLLSSD